MKKNALFLDRDGVINERLPGDYVKSPEAFVFCQGVLEAIKILSLHFQPVIVVTNQAGIGKGLMNEDNLKAIHDKMITAVANAGGRIDAIYCCPNIPADNSPCRKPDTGMGLQAQSDFPEIIFHNAWMVGDSLSDIEFGKRLGMKTALILGKIEEQALHAAITTDWKGNALIDFSKTILPH